MNPLSQVSPALLIVIYIWSIVAKGIALWRAAHLKQRNWFIAILILSTVGILELVYLFRFATKRLTIEEIRSWLPTSSK